MNELETNMKLIDKYVLEQLTYNYDKTKRKQILNALSQGQTTSIFSPIGQGRRRTEFGGNITQLS